MSSPKQSPYEHRQQRKLHEKQQAQRQEKIKSTQQSTDYLKLSPEDFEAFRHYDYQDVDWSEIEKRMAENIGLKFLDGIDFASTRDAMAYLYGKSPLGDDFRALDSRHTRWQTEILPEGSRRWTRDELRADPRPDLRPEPPMGYGMRDVRNMHRRMAWEEQKCEEGDEEFRHMTPPVDRMRDLLGRFGHEEVMRTLTQILEEMGDLENIMDILEPQTEQYAQRNVRDEIYPRKSGRF